MADPDEFLIAWGLFRKLEAAEQLPDPEVDRFVEAALDQVGEDGLLSGWGIVASILCQYLREHAAALGCDCGSLEWMEKVGLHYNAHDWNA
jgi:hypothetical protein